MDKTPVVTASNREHLLFHIDNNGGLYFCYDDGSIYKMSPLEQLAIAGEGWVRVTYPSATKIDFLDDLRSIADARYERYLHGDIA